MKNRRRTDWGYLTLCGLLAAAVVVPACWLVWQWDAPRRAALAAEAAREAEFREAYEANEREMKRATIERHRRRQEEDRQRGDERARILEESRRRLGSG